MTFGTRVLFEQQATSLHGAVDRQSGRGFVVLEELVRHRLLVKERCLPYKLKAGWTGDARELDADRLESRFHAASGTFDGLRIIRMVLGRENTFATYNHSDRSSKLRAELVISRAKNIQVALPAISTALRRDARMR